MWLASSAASAMQRATPRDLVGCGVRPRDQLTTRRAPASTPALAHSRPRLRDLREQSAPLAASIVERCVDEPPTHLREGGLFRDGIDAELDEAAPAAARRQRLAGGVPEAPRRARPASPRSRSATTRSSATTSRSRTRTREKCPTPSRRKQTLKNAERYITPELKEFEEKVTTAEARAIERENALCSIDSASRPRAQPSACRLRRRSSPSSMCSPCFADVARPIQLRAARDRRGAAVLDIVQGRHPVLDRTLGERFVPNDCVLARGETCEIRRRKRRRWRNESVVVRSPHSVTSSSSASPLKPQAVSSLPRPHHRPQHGGQDPRSSARSR